MEQMIDPKTLEKLEKLMTEAEGDCTSSNTLTVTEALGKAEVLRVILPFSIRADAVITTCMTTMMNKLLKGFKDE